MSLSPLFCYRIANLIILGMVPMNEIVAKWRAYVDQVDLENLATNGCRATFFGLMSRYIWYMRIKNGWKQFT